MSIADEIFIENVKDILANGVSDADMEVRPRWDDGAPAHTIKKFCVVNRYDLSKEFPITTLRYTNFRAALDEILWIWQKKSNNVNELNSHIFIVRRESAAGRRIDDQQHLPAVIRKVYVVPVHVSDRKIIHCFHRPFPLS